MEPNTPSPSKSLSQIRSTSLGTPYQSEAPARLPPVPMPRSTSTSQSSSSCARWAAVSNRMAPVQPFVYAVTTTKIYCLPTCPSRLARRANITFFDTPSQAEQEGYRACKRCRPNTSTVFRRRSLQSNPGTERRESLGEEIPEMKTEYDIQPEHEPASQKVEHAVNIIREVAEKGQKISLAELASKVGLSKWHLQRVFKAKIGRSPAELGNDMLERSRITPSSMDAASSIMTEPGMRSEIEAMTPLPGFAYQTPLEQNMSPSEMQTTIATPTTSSSGPDFPTDWAMPPHIFGGHDDNDYSRNELDFDISGLPENWSPVVEDMLRDLFPEIYTGESKFRTHHVPEK